MNFLAMSQKRNRMKVAQHTMRKFKQIVMLMGFPPLLFFLTFYLGIQAYRGHFLISLISVLAGSLLMSIFVSYMERNFQEGKDE